MRLVCGATYLQLALYLLTQVVLLMIIAIPLGLFLGNILLPVMSSIMAYYTGIELHIAIAKDAIITTVIVLSFVVFWTIILNLSLAYKNSATMMMNERSMKVNIPIGNSFIRMNTPFPKKLKTILGLLLLVFPLFAFYMNPFTGPGMAIAGLIGLNISFKAVISPFLDKRIDKKKIDQPISLAYLGFLRSDLHMMKLNIMLYMISSIILASLMITEDNNNVQTMLIVTSFVVMSILQALTIMFKFSSEFSGRRKHFHSLEQIGFIKRDLKKIIRKETIAFYCCIMAITLLFDVNLFVSYVINHLLSSEFILALLAILIIPMIFCCIITLLYYHRIIFKDKEVRINSH